MHYAVAAASDGYWQWEMHYAVAAASNGYLQWEVYQGVAAVEYVWIHACWMTCVKVRRADGFLTNIWKQHTPQLGGLTTLCNSKIVLAECNFFSD